MKQVKDSGDKNASPSGQPINQNQRAARFDLIIQKHLRKPTMVSDAKLQRWHDKYKKADGDLVNRDDLIIQEVQSDEFDHDAMDKCVEELAKEIIVEKMFCRDCQHLFDNWPDARNCPKQKTIARDCHTLVLEAAALKGCRFCTFMMQILRDSELLEAFRKIETRLEVLGDNAKAPLSLEYGQFSSDSDILWISFPGKTCKHSYSGVATDTCFASEHSEQTTDPYDDGRDVFEIAINWITECSESHGGCKKEEQDVLPTRLIYIGTDAPRLVLTAGWDIKPRYSTLSYAWGNSKFLKLTKKTYNLFLSMIPPQELPMTFKDAIHISRQLGLEYIWIDALCIIQGDVKDWRQESSLMSAVYGGSFVNIAASSAINVHGGCLNPHQEVHGLPVSITVNGSKSRRNFRCFDIYKRSVTESHLATRAWALQEKVLPSRTIHFGDCGAFWECKTKIANEHLPDGFDDTFGVALVTVRDGEETAERKWSKISKLYSQAALTYGRDKLPALAGMAMSIQKEMGGQYLAGLWRKNIEAQLCWRVWYLRKRPPWRAPSWSWASVDSGFLCEPKDQSNPMENSYAHVLDAEIMCVDQNPFGEVRGGRLRIGCSGMLVARLSGSETVRVENNCDKVPADVDYPVSLDCLEDELCDRDGRVYLLPILGGTFRKNGWDMNGVSLTCLIVMGILLSEAAGKSGDFCRVGQFQYIQDKNSNELGERMKGDRYDSFLEAFEHGAAAMAEDVCAEVIENSEYPEERYVIHLI